MFQVLLQFPPPQGTLIPCDFKPANPLKYFWRQRHDFQKFLLAKLASYGTKHAGSYWFPGFVNQDCRVLIETNVGAVAPAVFLVSTHDDRLDYGSFLDLSVRRCLFYAGRDDVTQACTQSG